MQYETYETLMCAVIVINRAGVKEENIMPADAESEWKETEHVSP